MSQSTKWFTITVVLAFSAFFSFAFINSEWGDKNNFNGLFGFLGIGLLLTVASIASLVKTIKVSQ